MLDLILGMVKIILAVTGIGLIAGAASAPGDQTLYSLAGGFCIGVYVMWQHTDGRR